MRFRLILPALVALVLIITACAPAPELRNDALLHDNSLLTDTPCAIPCWNNITPGETLWRDAVTIIEDDTRFSNVEFQNADDSDAQLAAWQEGDGQPCCQMITRDGESVDQLVLFTAPDINLGQVLDTRGDPVYVVGTEFTDDQAVMNLFYPDTGLIVFAFVAGPENGTLSASSEVVGLILTTDDLMDEFIQASDLYHWDGLKSYLDYNSEEFDVTAVPTATPEN
jgi:hypothetical protein